MKTFTALLSIFLSLLFTICNGQEKNNIIQRKKGKQEEIFIGKTFFEGDELNDYLFEKSENFINVDSLTYTIYRKIGTKDYILSLEKFIKNDDVRKYLIIDVVNFKNYDSSSLSIKESFIGGKVNLIVYQKKKFLKKWTFKKRKLNQTGLNNFTGRK